MYRSCKTVFGLAALLVLTVPDVHGDDRLAEGFRHVPPDSRLRMYWRIFGPAWTRPEIDYQLGLLAEAGIGGVTAYFMYPVELDDPQRGIVNQRFGSPEFLETLGHAARRARELGLRFSVNGSSGWPYGGPRVGLADAAQWVRQQVLAAGGDWKGPLTLAPGDSVLAAFQEGQEVTAALRAGTLSTPLTHPLRVFIAGPCGMRVKRPSFGGEGLALNHLDSGALERYLASVAEPMLQAAPGMVYGLGCDSLEVYGTNWTQDFPAVFRQQRGYDLVGRLPELFDDRAPAVKGLRFDFWRTLAELAEERFAKPLGEWAGRQGVKLEMEAYGIPPLPMTAARYIDIPTGEHYEWQGYAVQRFVASSANLTGRRIVGAEAWTWAGLPNRLADSLSDLKLVSDLTFLCGANDLTAVDFPYSPRAVGAPGWQPYYGPTMNQNNPQWAFFPELVRYINRCQWLLRQGRPLREVLVYLPVEDVMGRAGASSLQLDFEVRDWFVTGPATGEFGLGNALRHRSDLLHGLTVQGFDYDGIDFWGMIRLAQVQDGRLIAGDGRYSAIILPHLETIEPAALEKVAAFCHAGGAVLASRRIPDRAAGLHLDSNDDHVRRLVADVFGESPQPGQVHHYGAGQAFLVTDDAGVALLLATLIQPDVRLEPPQPTVGYVHRTTDAGEIYFFANAGASAASFQATFKGAARRVELWDPLRGAITVPPASASNGRTCVALTLAPRQSIFVVLDRSTAVAAPAPQRRARLRAVPLDLSWDVHFDGLDAPPPAQTGVLNSWTLWPGAKYFSGLATYTATFNWDRGPEESCMLAFDEIHEAAAVTLNGRHMGVVFVPPLELDITAGLQKGRNMLEITVANLPVNRFLGLPEGDLKPLEQKYGNRFPAPEEKHIMPGPAPSGIIGSVQLLVADSQ